jgi:lycopene beta-cyclase
VPTHAAAPDVVLVGGGLANSLIALRLRQRRPGTRVVLVERGARLGGNHTWSCFGPDLTPAQHAWVRPLVAHAWPAYDVRFPEVARRLQTPYLSITSGRLHQVVAGELGGDCWLGADVVEVTPREVTLADGCTVKAGAVIDARGPAPSDRFVLAYQKFVGRELRLARPHGLRVPILMDARVPQLDGFRFVYVLPLDDTRVLVEDTRYSDTPHLDRAALGDEIDRYVGAAGWHAAATLREEHGVLPVALDGDARDCWGDEPEVALAGLRAGLFHPTTGYSLPDAVRLADAIAALPEITAARVLEVTRARAIATWDQRWFFRMLNRMMFGAGEASGRYRILQRFYTMPDALIERFYAGHLTWADILRLLVGRPPVPLLPALACVRPARARRRQDPREVAIVAEARRRGSR